jgi:NAD+ synthase
MEKQMDKIVNWLQNQVKNSQTKGILVGLSGGIDSAVVACLIKKAFPDNALGVILPCKSQEVDREDALSLSKACGIKALEVDLSQTHEILLEAIGKGMGVSEFQNRMTDANLRARLRMTTLYGIANEKNYLVAGTDNAAELLTGYFTKYGDGGVDILPIAHLTKAEVFQWAKDLGVPKSIIERKPSAGLWEGQTDEDEMGVTYNEIDAYILGEAISDQSREKIERMHKITDHKRLMPPMPPK